MLITVITVGVSKPTQQKTRPNLDLNSYLLAECFQGLCDADFHFKISKYPNVFFPVHFTFSGIFLISGLRKVGEDEISAVQFGAVAVTKTHLDGAFLSDSAGMHSNQSKKTNQYVSV